jgi:hypothetical protein
MTEKSSQNDLTPKQLINPKAANFNPKAANITPKQLI